MATSASARDNLALRGVAAVGSRLSWARLIREGIVVAVTLEFLLLWGLSEKFLTWANLRLVLLQAAVVAILAVPSTMVLLAGYVDFAIGSILGLTAVVLGQFLEAARPVGAADVVVAAILACVLAMTIGGVQGVLASTLRFPVIVVTLGFFTAVRGLTFVVSGGRLTSGFGNTFALIGRGQVYVLDVPVPIVMTAIVFSVGALILYQTRWGRYIVAIGGARAAAFRAGIKVLRIPVLLYMGTGLGAALGALVLVSRLDSAPPTLGEGLELQVLGAVLLGGVAFGGGRGNLLGVGAGVLFISLMNNGLLLLGVPPFWFRVSSGAALVVAAGLDALAQRIEKREQGVSVGGDLSLGT